MLASKSLGRCRCIDLIMLRVAIKGHVCTWTELVTRHVDAGRVPKPTAVRTAKCISAALILSLVPRRVALLVPACVYNHIPSLAFVERETESWNAK